MIRFGPAGMPIACKGMKLFEGIKYTKKVGLSAFEVEFVRGVRIRKEDAEEACKIAKQNDVLLSCHAPYWINCCSEKKEKQQITIRNILETARAASLLNAWIIAFHPGYYQKLGKEKAFSNALSLLQEIEKKMKNEKLHAVLGIETTGKKSQFGSLDEIIELCKRLKHALPVIDFAHIHARDNGMLKSKQDYEKIFEKIKILKAKRVHCHFTGIEYSEKGERYHVPIGEKNSPDFFLLAEVLAKEKQDITIISESPLLEQDALKMKKILERFK